MKKEAPQTKAKRFFRLPTLALTAGSLMLGTLALPSTALAVRNVNLLDSGRLALLTKGLQAGTAEAQKCQVIKPQVSHILLAEEMLKPLFPKPNDDATTGELAHRPRQAPLGIGPVLEHVQNFMTAAAPRGTLLHRS